VVQINNYKLKIVKNMENNNTNTTNSKDNNKTDLGPIFIGTIIFSVVFLISAYLISEAISSLRSSETITVKGYAEMNITSDFATWTGTFSSTANNLSDGFAKMKTNKERIEKYLTENGFSSDSIEFQILASNENFDYTPHGARRAGYRFYQNFTVTSFDVYKIKSISSKITDLIGEGIEINSWQPQYSYTKLNDLKSQMLGAATQDAQIRAEEIAKSGGSKIGRILSASQGIFQITAPNSNEISDYGINDMTSIEKTIKSVVTVRYSIQ